jgi:probable poly-beta-1,6-N-acetyl-D-glucosamine export protein
MAELFWKLAETGVGEVMSERIEYFDFLRGIAIIMVVAIHTFGSSYTYESISLLGISARQLTNCAVPIFLVSSAFLLGNKIFANK